MVGSGVIEADCKTVIGSRCKPSGMFWTVRAANAILALRWGHLNGRFGDYWEAIGLNLHFYVALDRHVSMYSAPLRPASHFGIINITDAIARLETRSSGLKTALISAITACAEQRFQKKARKFLLGLSTDELQYIAEFLGACVLESLGRSALSRRELSEGIVQFEQVRRAPADCFNDREHKMILLLEYLRRNKLTHCSLAAPAERT